MVLTDRIRETKVSINNDYVLRVRNTTDRLLAKEILFIQLLNYYHKERTVIFVQLTAKLDFFLINDFGCNLK